MNIFKSLWNKFTRKKEPAYTPIVQSGSVAAPKPSLRSIIRRGSRLFKQERKRSKKHKLHASHFGNYAPMKRLPRFIQVGENRLTSISYRHKVGPCGVHPI